MRRDRYLLVLAVVVLGTGLFAWSDRATAHDKDYESRLTIHKKVLPSGPNNNRVSYRVELFSDLNTCIVGRKVKLITTPEGGGFQRTMHTRDEGRIRFVVTFGGRVPEVYAKVKRVETPGPHDHVCLPDRSRTV